MEEAKNLQPTQIRTIENHSILAICRLQLEVLHRRLLMLQVTMEQVVVGTEMITQVIPFTNRHLDRAHGSNLVVQDSREEMPILMIRVQEAKVALLKAIEGMISTTSKRRSLPAMDLDHIILDQVHHNLPILPNSHNLKNRNSKEEILLLSNLWLLVGQMMDSEVGHLNQWGLVISAARAISIKEDNNNNSKVTTVSDRNSRTIMRMRFPSR